MNKWIPNLPINANVFEIRKMMLHIELLEFCEVTKPMLDTETSINARTMYIVNTLNAICFNSNLLDERGVLLPELIEYIRMRII